MEVELVVSSSKFGYNSRPRFSVHVDRGGYSGYFVLLAALGILHVDETETRQMKGCAHDTEVFS